MSVYQNNFTKYKSGQFWGLVEQKGPWKTTASDIARSKDYKERKAGGGVGIQQNTGNANAEQVVNPYVVDGRKPVPAFPRYKQKSIVQSKKIKFSSGRKKKRYRPINRADIDYIESSSDDEEEVITETNKIDKPKLRIDTASVPPSLQGLLQKGRIEEASHPRKKDSLPEVADYTDKERETYQEKILKKIKRRLKVT